MSIDEIFWHDTVIRRVVELCDSDTLVFEVDYLVDGDAQRFEPRWIVFRDMLRYSVREGSFHGYPTILEVAEKARDDGPDRIERFELTLETTAGQRVLQCSAVELHVSSASAFA